MADEIEIVEEPVEETVPEPIVCSGGFVIPLPTGGN
jgi:hypothetical protein